MRIFLSIITEVYSGSYKELGAIEDIKYYNENNYWEVYANGEKWHGKVIYERDL